MTTLCLINLVAFVALLPAGDTSSLPKLTTASAGGAQQSARSGDSWLDRRVVNWNRRISGLPHPVRSINAAEVRRRCRDLVRQPDSPAERALVRAGWMLYGPVQSSGPTAVVTAMSGADGMCRPLGYQAFVYWEGRYAGTLSPVTMNSRTDGALSNVRLLGPTRISAEFARYNRSDPLCCPSRTSHVTYEVRGDNLPLVAPVNIETMPVGPPAEGPGSDSGSSNAAQLFGRRWRLTEVDGAAVRTTKPYIEFDRAGKRASGDGGCNRFSGGFEVDGTNLRFSRVISTKRACLDREDQQVEINFLERLEQTTSFRIQGDILRLFAGRRAILTFKADGTDGGGTPQETRVTGTVTYLERIALPPGAVIEVKLLNISRVPPVTIAEQTIEPAGRQVPIEFELRYDPRRIDRRYRYAIQARILQGNRPRFISNQPYLVITGGHSNIVNVIVKPVRR